MTVALAEVLAHLDDTLAIASFRDYGTNGLQVEGRAPVERVITAVSVSGALIERAIAQSADLLVVHHGLIWGSGLTSITGVSARRIAALMSHGMSLAAYHLPLDAHPRLGNNVGLCDALGLGPARHTFGNVKGIELGWAGSWSQPIRRAEAIERVGLGVCNGSAPAFVFPYGPAEVRKVGVCTGAAADLLEDAARAGCDLFVTGELAERAGELARELGISLVAAGHYNTEVFGPKRLATELQRHFRGLDVRYVDVPSPL